MEPGHEDREYRSVRDAISRKEKLPQWSPVMKTGNTMGPERTDAALRMPQWSPVMKTGNTRSSTIPAGRSTSLNGARS